MRELFNKIRNDYLTSALAAIAVGLLMVIFCSVALTVACVALGILAVVLGIVSIVRFFRQPKGENRYELLSGLVLTALGLFVIVRPSVVYDIVWVAMGILMIFHGLLAAMHTVRMFKASYRYWFVGLIVTVITVAAGVVVTFLHGLTPKAMALTAGLLFLLEGLLNLWTSIKGKKKT